jgi:hypothetical protein
VPVPVVSAPFVGMLVAPPFGVPGAVAGLTDLVLPDVSPPGPVVCGVPAVVGLPIPPLPGVPGADVGSPVTALLGVSVLVWPPAVALFGLLGEVVGLPVTVLPGVPGELVGLPVAALLGLLGKVVGLLDVALLGVSVVVGLPVVALLCAALPVEPLSGTELVALAADVAVAGGGSTTGAGLAGLRYSGAALS